MNEVDQVDPRQKKKTQRKKSEQRGLWKNLQNLQGLESVSPDAPFSAAAGRGERGSLRDPSLSFVPSARRIFFLVVHFYRSFPLRATARVSAACGFCWLRYAGHIPRTGQLLDTLAKMQTLPPARRATCRTRHRQTLRLLEGL